MKKKYLLFDLDGTLMDSRDAVIHATFHVSERYAPSKYTYKDTVERFGEVTGDFLTTLSDDLDSVKEDYFKYISTMESLPFKGVSECLKRLKENGYILGIVTNKQKKLAIKDLQTNHLINLFSTIISVDDVSNGKPSKDMVIKAMDYLGATPSETLLIGDSIFDKKASESAKVDFVMMDWYKEFSSSEFSFYLTDLYQLENNVLKESGDLNVG